MLLSWRVNFDHHYMGWRLRLDRDGNSKHLYRIANIGFDFLLCFRHDFRFGLEWMCYRRDVCDCFLQPVFVGGNRYNFVSSVLQWRGWDRKLAGV